MRQYGKHFWRTVPFVRLLIPLTAGILLEQYFDYPLLPVISIAAACFSIYCIVTLLPVIQKYKLRWITGLCIQLFILCAGSANIHLQNIEKDPDWIGHHIKEQASLYATIQEPLTSKPNSYKTIAKAEWVKTADGWKRVKGNVLVYFKKDSTAPAVDYGTQLIIRKPLQPITNSGNPGSFDYKRYAAFQDIHHQTYLTKNDYQVIAGLKKKLLSESLIQSRNYILSILRKWIPGQKETGVAEALLIGYRNDLDKELVQSYSNTGVVHIIAISGLHLGMIYGLLVFLLKPFKKRNWIAWARPLIILIILWGFSLLAGAVASILRSAVMFSFIVIGESLSRRTNIYNTLAASAFCLLVYDPHFFWDVGFQLSYAAVLSIVLFMKPLYKQLYFTNKILNGIWQLNAVTIAAQILTLPLILYYFHQFPNLFLFTNFVAVPLSGFILYGELLLMVLARIPVLNVYIGKLISFLITEMNGVIERTDSLPFAVTDHIQVSLLQTILLFLAIGYLAWWLMLKKVKGLVTGLVFIAGFIFLGSLTNIRQQQQHKLILYNIPNRTAIDVIDGKRYQYTGDQLLAEKGPLQRFHLTPSRTAHGVNEWGYLPNTVITGQMILTAGKSVLIINKSIHFPPVQKKIPVDIIILSGNPGIYLSQLAAVFDCKQYLFDSSNPMWKIRYWKKDADNLHLRHHTISEQGAFEVDL